MLNSFDSLNEGDQYYHMIINVWKQKQVIQECVAKPWTDCS